MGIILSVLRSKNKTIDSILATIISAILFFATYHMLSSFFNDGSFIVNTIISICVSALTFWFVRKRWYKNVYRALIIVAVFTILASLLALLPVMFPTLAQGEGGVWWFFFMGIPLFVIGFVPSVIIVTILKVIYDKFMLYKRDYNNATVSLSLFFIMFLSVELILFLTKNNLITREFFREGTYPIVVFPWVIVVWLSSKIASFVINKFKIYESQMAKISFIPSLNAVIVSMFILLGAALLAQIE